MDELLQFYERELGTLHAHNQAFARRYPAIAGALGIQGGDMGDPHLARMLQAFAMFNARTAKRLADGFGTFSETLLEVNFPHYLRPFPACAIARIDNDLATVTEPAMIPRGTVMHAAEHQGVTCKFTTVYDVAVAPLRLSDVRFQSIVAAPPALRLTPDLGAAISVTLEATGATSTLDGLPLPMLRLFLDGEPAFCATLRDSLFLRTRRACVEVDGAWHALDAVPLHPVGFAAEDALIPARAASHPAYRLLGEWFAFPDKFNFVDLDMAALRPLLPPACRRCTVHLLLADVQADADIARILRPLSARHLVTGCTPVVNLFRQAANPIRLTHASAEHVLLPSVRQAHCYDIHSVDSVQVLGETAQGAALDTFYPFYSMRHGEAGGRQGRYWVTRRDEDMALSNPGYDMRIAFVDGTMQPLHDATQTVSIMLTCSNRDLPSRLVFGNAAGDLRHDGVASALPVRLLRKPSAACRFPAGVASHWRLIAQLSLNHQSLSEQGLPLFKQILELYNLPGSASAARQIAGMTGLRQRAASTWLQDEAGGSLVFGIDVLLSVDEDAFVGSGLHAFAQVIERFLGLYVHLGSFTRLIVLSQKTGKELLCCLPRNGNQALV
ncbi:type VI secretion system baseplate subunit TssF [Janthinobacterium agaricidamnosum]|uniref:Type VI secretion system baseplate subunit TssF n=1 Tax=Janthinobacterium agaricidamnosum TaxID=55508 RepID=A0A3G2EBY8_9BURK|nr:type VI secretion system baseplate subunit TssF [Janthinobacterium agaricidamnosum]AYM77791.1 type VI secretion system baseplate subunit TssF [Janthinobacterium agaricidamnosum]